MASHKKNLKYWMWFFIAMGILSVVELTTRQMVAEFAMETYGREAAQIGLGLITAVLLFDFGFSGGVVATVKFILSPAIIYFIFVALLYREIKRISSDTHNGKQNEKLSKR